MKKLIFIVLSITMLIISCGAVFAAETVSDDVITVTSDKDFYVALGSDLSDAQKSTVLSLMGLTTDDINSENTIYVTNDEEHSYLDEYLSSDVIGTKSLSSVMVKPLAKGSGVVVKTSNINYCNEAMYVNALVTAGVSDVEVVVTAPSPISGTAALIGAIKAYSELSGKNIDDSALDTALNELVTTGEVKEALNDDEKANELISYIKAQIAANDLDTVEEIEAAVRKGNEELKANLTEEQINQIIDVMMKIKAMGIDFEVLANQADKIYAKYGEQIKNGTFNIDDVDWKELGIGEIVANAVGNMVNNIGNAVKVFLGGIFSKK